MVQNDLMTIKEKSDRLSWVVVVAVPFAVMPARPWEKHQAELSPSIGNRSNEWFLPRKTEFKGWVTDYKQCSYQGLTDTEVSDFIGDLK